MLVMVLLMKISQQFVTAAAKTHVLELADVGTPFDRTDDGAILLCQKKPHMVLRALFA